MSDAVRCGGRATPTTLPVMRLAESLRWCRAVGLRCRNTPEYEKRRKGCYIAEWNADDVRVESTVQTTLQNTFYTLSSTAQTILRPHGPPTFRPTSQVGSEAFRCSRPVQGRRPIVLLPAVLSDTVRPGSDARAFRLVRFETLPCVRFWLSDKPECECPCRRRDRAIRMFVIGHALGAIVRRLSEFCPTLSLTLPPTRSVGPPLRWPLGPLSRAHTLRPRIISSQLSF